MNIAADFIALATVYALIAAAGLVIHAVMAPVGV